MIPRHIKVIKIGPRYYSAFLGERQHIYAFIKSEPLRNCQRFLNEYKSFYSSYPPADNSLNRITKGDEDLDEVPQIHLELYDSFQRQCLMYNVGLVSIEKFQYEFKNDRFDVNVSVASILPDISDSERVELLNYVLMLSEDDDGNGGE